MGFKARTLFTSVLLAGLVLVGCSDDKDVTNTTIQEQAAKNEIVADVTLPTTMAIPTLDPHLALNENVNITSHIFETLFAQNENYEAEPLLAESYEVSEDGKTFTFQLRHGVLFHNNEEMKADDVAASLNRWKSVVARGQLLIGDAEFTVVDDYTVTVTLLSPSNDFPLQLSHKLNAAVIMPKEVVESAIETGVTEYIGTGPYKFVEWKADQYVTLERFADYVALDTPQSGFAGNKTPKFEKVNIPINTDSASTFSSFLSGEYDYANVSVDNLPQVENLPDVKVDKRATGDFNLIFNKKSEFFSDLKYRQAVAAAIDVEAILLGITSDPELISLNSSYVFKENSKYYYEADTKYYNQNDQEEAKALLAETGYAGEEIHLLTSKDLGGVFYSATIVLADQLEQIGFNVKIDVYDFATLLTKRADAEAWDIYIGNFAVPASPTQLLYIYPNYGFAEDPQLAQYIQELSAAQDEETLKQANAQLQQYIWDTLNSIKIGNVYSYYAVREDLYDVVTITGATLLPALEK